MSTEEKVVNGKYKERGARKIGIAARADGIPENLSNWGIMFEKLKILNVKRDFYLSGDLKTISSWTGENL